MPLNGIVTPSPGVDDTCDLPALRAYLLAHAIPGVDVVMTRSDGSTEHRRTLPVGRRTVPLEVTIPAAEQGRPLIRIGARTTTAAGHEASSAARRWLGLDTDPRAAVAALSSDPVLGPLVRTRPNLRVPGALDPFEGAVFVVLGQHVSLAAARAFAGRLVAHHRGFPSAQSLAGADPARLREVVGVTGARAETIVAIARAVADGSLPLAPPSADSPVTPDLETTRARLLALPGVGPWTADLIALRCLRDPDVFLPGDLVLRKALGGVTAREAAKIADAWRPHRSLAVLHLWTHHALLPPA